MIIEHGLSHCMQLTISYLEYPPIKWEYSPLTSSDILLKNVLGSPLRKHSYRSRIQDSSATMTFVTPNNTGQFP
jgi:hypothetical protein